MKYTIKSSISTQHNVNADEKDQHNVPLPEKLESVITYNVITSISTSGSTQLTVDEIKNDLRTQFKISHAVSESLIRNKVEATGSIDNNYNLFYSVTTPFISGSITGSL